MLALLISGAMVAAAADATALTTQPLPKAIVRNANPLQRAVWACEARGQATSAHARVFLGAVDNGAGRVDQPPLTLTASTLVGIGQMSNDRGWFNIRFSCSLTPALDHAQSFIATVLSPMKSDDATPTPAIPAVRGNEWYVTQAGELRLTHGVKETDDRDFLASCAAKSGVVSLRLAHTAAWLTAGGYATIAIAVNGKSLLYIARGVKDENLGAIIPVVSLAAGDPLFAQMTAGTDLSINIGADTVYSVLLKDAAPSVQSFITGCTHA